MTDDAEDTVTETPYNGVDFGEIVFLREAVQQCRTAERAHSRALAVTLQSADDFWDAVDQILTATTRVANIFWPSAPRGGAKRRARQLRERLEFESEMRTATVREVRNGFEHFDERIDTWLLEDRSMFVDRNITSSEGPRLIGGPAAELVEQSTARHYLTDTQEVRVFDVSVALAALLDEIREIRERVEAELDEAKVSA